MCTTGNTSGITGTGIDRTWLLNYKQHIECDVSAFSTFIKNSNTTPFQTLEEQTYRVAEFCARVDEWVVVTTNPPNPINQCLYMNHHQLQDSSTFYFLDVLHCATAFNIMPARGLCLLKWGSGIKHAQKHKVIFLKILLLPSFFFYRVFIFCLLDGILKMPPIKS